VRHHCCKDWQKKVFSNKNYYLHFSASFLFSFSPYDLIVSFYLFIVKTFTKRIKNIFYRPPPVQKLKRKRLSPTPALFHAHCQKKWGGGTKIIYLFMTIFIYGI